MGSDTRDDNIVVVKNNESDTTATIVIKNNIEFNPKVSVVIPVYNVEKYLRECLDSVINQTLKEIEIICVDDGSTDKTLEILEEYAHKDNRITILSQQNLHAGVARNAGMAVARGEYIQFLDGDDYFELSMLEKLYNKATQFDSDMVVCEAAEFDNANGKILRVFGINYSILPNENLFDSNDCVAYWSRVFMSAAWTRLFKLNFLKNNGLFFQNLFSFNDIGFTLCSTAVAKRISLVPEVLLYYRRNIPNAITVSRGKTAFDMILAYDFVKKFLKEHNLENFLFSLNESFKNNVSIVVQACNFSEFCIFKNKAKEFLGDDWKNFKKCFRKKSKLSDLPKMFFNVANAPTKTHKIITFCGIKLKIKIPDKVAMEKFIYHNIREKRVLLVEMNSFHGECLPGMAKYFLDLGFNVDVLLNNSEYELNPFSNFLNDKLSIFPANSEVIASILRSDIVEKYEHLYINSDRIYDGPVSQYLGNDLKYPTGKILIMCHHSELYDEINCKTHNSNVLSLAALPTLADKEYKMVNTHFFKYMRERKKNKTTRFIVIGNIETSRKNHNILLDVVQGLVADGITDFKIVIVSRIGKFDVPENLSQYFEFKGKLAYGEMYAEVEKADFFLTLFDVDNPVHERYLTCGTSGSYQLIYGFNIPALIPYKFHGELNGFDNTNSIGYENNDDFINAMRTAISMENDEYQNYVVALKKLSTAIYNKSLNNLRELIAEECVFPQNTFVSLGINCFNRVVLTRYHLKHKKSAGELSLPFDLCVCPIESVLKCLKDDFKGYFDDLKFDKDKNIWVNNSLRISYNHDLDCSEKNKEKLVERYTKRITNLNELLSNNDEKIFVLSIISPSEKEPMHINELYELLKQRCNTGFKLVVVLISKNMPFDKELINSDIAFKHIPHPYPNFGGEWFKGEFFNSNEGIAFEREYVDFVQSFAQEVENNA